MSFAARHSVCFPTPVPKTMRARSQDRGGGRNCSVLLGGVRACVCMCTSVHMVRVLCARLWG